MARKSTISRLASDRVISVARDWFVDSFHLQFDDAIKVGAVAFLAHGDEIVALVIAAGTMLVSLLILLIVNALAKRATRPTRKPLTASEIQFDAELAEMVNAASRSI